MIVRRLPEAVVNRIAAGEVVERPASVVKELVENSIDAGATEIRVLIRDGGRASICVADNGCGMASDDLWLAVDRHATSKLADDALQRIDTFGFRGEALPSIAAVSRLTITTRRAGDEAGCSLEVAAGQKSVLKPAVRAAGTHVEVRDLFFATPARLKFLKAAASETRHVLEAVQRLAMAHSRVGFVLKDETRALLSLEAAARAGEDDRLRRLGKILGAEFARSAVALVGEREGARVSGFAGLPTLNRRLASLQFLFVNGRPVRDRLLYGAVRAAYQGLLPSDRHPVAALFVDVAPEDVDVNVHPMKAEVRFRDANLVRGLIVSTLRNALAGAGHRAASTVSQFGGRGAQGSALHRPPAGPRPDSPLWETPRTPSFSGLREEHDLHDLAPPRAETGGDADRSNARKEDDDAQAAARPPLGLARAQVHATYIIAETADGLVIVDQHAAHERLTQERLKATMAAGGPARQGLLIPEVVELDEAHAEALVAEAGSLAALGLAVEAFGPGAVVVREIPALLGTADITGLVRDLADELVGHGASSSLSERMDQIIATIACHSSVRAGRRLNANEMDALLRAMEATAFAGQCSHGRPTYVELKLADIEKLFGRR